MEKIRRGMLVEYIGDVDCFKNLIGRAGYCMLDDIEVTFQMSAREKNAPNRMYLAKVKVTCKPEELKAITNLADETEFIKANSHYNGRVICTQFKSADTHFIVGKEYEIIDGQIYTENGDPYFARPIYRLDETGLWLQFEPVGE